jgi:serine/threonine-protein kinase
LALAPAAILLAVMLRRRGRRTRRDRSATASGALAGGRRVGGYRVLGELGRGGMAVTYRARRRSDGHEVALKVPRESPDPTYLERFLREGKLGETLHHPGIVRIFEAAEDHGLPFLAMELIPGRTLRAELDAAPGGLPERRALEIARAIAEALDYAHGKSVVHRDLKPENIMLLPEGGLKVMDFGVARVDGQPGLTTSQIFFGSPLYAAPELVEPRTIDHRADLYSLGILLYEMLEGAPPFIHESVFKLLEMHQSSRLPDPAALPRPLPPALWAILARLCEKRPDRRYGSAQELLVDLDRLLYQDAAGQRRSRVAPALGTR